MRFKLPFRHSRSRRSSQLLGSRRRSRRCIEALEDRRLLATVPPGFTAPLVTSGLSGPTAMDFAPNGELWVLQQTGAVKLIRQNGTAHTAATLTVDSQSERGLLGLAFDPLYDGAGSRTDYLYLYYTALNGGPTDRRHNRISRFTVTGAGTTTPTLGSELIIRELPPEDEDGDGNHNGGAIHFGVDGMLYVAVGDHNYDQQGQANHVSQILTTPFGKMLRIKPDGTNPSDNPFYAGSSSDWQGAIWAMGLRNPYTFAVEPGTGRIFINDVGEGIWEEINLGERGANYGWAGSGSPVWEGFEQPPPPWANYRNPVMTYDHSGSAPTPAGQAISGGAFYPANSQFGSAYAGKYFFADPYGGFIRIFDPANPGTVATPDTSVAFAGNLTSDAPVDLKVDSSGNLYYLDIFNGQVWRISLTAGPQVIDNGDTAYTKTGSWLPGYNVGRDIDFDVVLNAGGTPETATWTFTVTPGQYRVSTTWFENANYWATAAPFSVLDGAVARGGRSINQRFAPNDFSYAGSSWEDVGTFDITGTTLTVRLSSDNAGGYVAADAVRIERVGALSSGPEIQITEAGRDVPHASPGIVSFGSVEINDPATRTFVISNTGLQPLQLTGAISVPAGYTVITPPALTTLTTGQTTSFVVRLQNTSPGVYAGTISIPTNDSNENPFTFTVTGTVLTTRILDNGQPGYTQNELFTTAAVAIARDGDAAYCVGQPATISQAEWTLSVAPGQYRVAATWYVNSTYWATNAPFTILDGATPLGTVTINQRLDPDDFTASGSAWEFLGGTFNITSGTLTVRLTNVGTNGYVIADAIRVERIGSLNPNLNSLSSPSGAIPAGNSFVSDQSSTGESAELLATAYAEPELDEFAADVARGAVASRLDSPASDDLTAGGVSSAEALVHDEVLAEVADEPDLIAL